MKKCCQTIKPETSNFKCFIALLFLFFIFGNGHSQSIDLDDLPNVSDYTVTRTTSGTDTVVLVLHGGPSSDLFEGGFFDFESESTFSVVEVMKSEMLSQMLEKPSISYDECIATNDTTAALIQKSILHNKSLDKYVVLVGHSWGAIIIGEYLDDYGNEFVDKIIPMSGRISVPLEFVDLLKDGILPRFPDGVTITVDPNENYPYPNILLLASAAFENRWIDSLQNLDLENLLYVHAEFDEATGRLLPEEVDFLNDSGAQILYLEGGDHGSAFDISSHDIYMDFIRGSNPMVVIEEIEFAALNLYPTLANDLVNLTTESAGKLTIYNFSGSQIENRNLERGQSTLEVSHYNTGQYIAHYTSQSGHVSIGRFQVFK